MADSLATSPSLATAAELTALAGSLDGLAAGLHNAELLTKLGLAQTRAVKKRTRAGQNPDGSLFAPYSEGYAKRRTEAGVPTKRDMLMYGVRYEMRGEGGVYVSNAYDTMLDHLHEQIAPDLQSVTLAFVREDKATIAGYHNEGEGNNPKREFAVVTDPEADALATLVAGDLDHILQLHGFA